MGFPSGDPNQHFQSLQLNYDLPFAKFPFLRWIRATYSYQGDYQWQDGSDLFSNVPITDANGDVTFFNLGNSIQNASTHRINSTLDMNTFYRYVGLTKINPNSRRNRNRGVEEVALELVEAAAEQAVKEVKKEMKTLKKEANIGWWCKCRRRTWWCRKRWCRR